MARKFKPRIVGPPLPKRNREEALLRRIGATITSPAEFEQAILLQPVYLRSAWREKLIPYLKFKVETPVLEETA